MITITGEPKEIAALVVALQERQNRNGIKPSVPWKDARDRVMKKCIESENYSLLDAH